VSAVLVSQQRALVETYHCVHHTLHGSHNATYTARHTRAAGGGAAGFLAHFSRQLTISAVDQLAHQPGLSLAQQSLTSQHTVAFDINGNDGRLVHVESAGAARFNGALTTETFSSGTTHHRKFQHTPAFLRDDGEMAESFSLTLLSSSLTRLPTVQESEIDAMAEAAAGVVTDAATLSVRSAVAAAAEASSGSHGRTTTASSGDAAAISADASSSQSLEVALESRALWTSWRLSDRVASRLDAHHDRVGMWTRSVTARTDGKQRPLHFNKRGTDAEFRSDRRGAVSGRRTWKRARFTALTDSTVTETHDGEFVTAQSLLLPVVSCLRDATSASDVESDVLVCGTALADAFRQHAQVLEPIMAQLLTFPESSADLPSWLAPHRSIQLQIIAYGADANADAVSMFFQHAGECTYALAHEC
jgi:hypothetical protein